MLGEARDEGGGRFIDLHGGGKGVLVSDGGAAGTGSGAQGNRRAGGLDIFSVWGEVGLAGGRQVSSLGSIFSQVLGRVGLMLGSGIPMGNESRMVSVMCLWIGGGLWVCFVPFVLARLRRW